MRAPVMLLVVGIFACKAPTEGNGTTLAESDSEASTESTATTGDTETDDSQTTDPTTDATEATTDSDSDMGTTDGETDPTTGGGPFDDAVQYFCFGTCRVSAPPVGVDDCDQEDADQFCQLILNDPQAHATSWEAEPVMHGPGFCCSDVGFGMTVEFGDYDICWEPGDLLPDHNEGGTVIPRASLVCVGG